MRWNARDDGTSSVLAAFYFSSSVAFMRGGFQERVIENRIRNDRQDIKQSIQTHTR